MLPAVTADAALGELGPRLRAVAEQVLVDLPVADLCCDHAALALALVRSGRVPRAIAVDVAPSPLVGARRRIAAVDVVLPWST